jgi:hypothetical protein
MPASGQMKSIFRTWQGIGQSVDLSENGEKSDVPRSILANYALFFANVSPFRVNACASNSDHVVSCAMAQFACAARGRLFSADCTLAFWSRGNHLPLSV